MVTERKRYVIPDELDEEEEEEEDEEEDDEEVTPPPPVKRGRTSRNSRREVVPPDTDDTPPEPKPLPRSTRRSGGADYSELCEPDTRGHGLTRQPSKSRVSNRTKVDPTKVGLFSLILGFKIPLSVNHLCISGFNNSVVISMPTGDRESSLQTTETEISLAIQRTS